MNEKELWLKNTSGSDVNLSDLGVKVRRGKVINVFKYNPHLTLDKVKQSMESGSLSKRLLSGVLSKASGPVNSRPNSLNKVGLSDKSVTIKKSNTSVLVESGNKDLGSDNQQDDSFGFADYGISDLGEVVQEKSGAAVVVRQNEGEEPVNPGEEILKPVESTNPVSKQSLITMQSQKEKMESPLGKQAPVVDTPALTAQPFIITKPDGTPEVRSLTKEAKVESKTAKKKAKKKVSKKKLINPKVSGNVITPQSGIDASSRVVSLTQALNKEAKALGVDVADLPEDVVIAIEAVIIGDRIIKDDAKGKFDSQVATKTKDGATVMKIKEVSK